MAQLKHQSGGVPQNAIGRKPHSMSDRDAGSRDTVYRAPAKKAAPARSGGGGGGGGGSKKSGGGGHQRTPQKGPIPEARPNLTLGGTPTQGYGSPSTFPMRPEPVIPQMPPMMPPLTGVPPDLLNPGPNLTLGGTPTQGYGSPSTFPDRPPIPQPPPVGPGGTPLDPGNMRGMPNPLMPPPAGPSNPDRAGLAAAMARVPPPQQPGSILPGKDALDAMGPDWLRKFFGG